MSNQHTVNHNESISFPGALKSNFASQEIVERRNLQMDNAQVTPIPWKQIHRANVPHLARHSNS